MISAKLVKLIRESEGCSLQEAKEILIRANSEALNDKRLEIASRLMQAIITWESGVYIAPGSTMSQQQAAAELALLNADALIAAHNATADGGGGE